MLVFFCKFQAQLRKTFIVLVLLQLALLALQLVQLLAMNYLPVVMLPEYLTVAH